MIKKGNKLYSILKFKCPHCHEGEFFKSHPFDLLKAGQINETCSVCGKSNSKEIGFYYGSMYVSYALGVALFVAVYTIILLFFPDTTSVTSAIIIVISLVLASPIMYALSKIIWANLFFKYDKNLIKK